MSAKTDLINHGNQLNPQHPAYHSSRAGSGCDDDEDTSSIDMQRSLSSQLAEWSSGIRRAEEARPTRELFLIDLLSLNGTRACLSVTAVLPDENFANEYVRDRIDMVECILQRLSSHFVKIGGSPIAWSQVRGENGMPLEWLGAQFSPFPASIHRTQEKQAEQTEHNALWASQGASLIAAFKTFLTCETAIRREHLGDLTVAEAIRIKRGYL